METIATSAAFKTAFCAAALPLSTSTLLTA
jgi:hypothetical protein